MNNQSLYSKKKDFLKEWPIERLVTMQINEYTNLDKTSFCYWLEAITTDLGSVWGGSAYKFGIFKRKDLESDNYNDKRKSDGEYAWYGKYGNSKEDVFNTIKNSILEIAKNSQEDKLEEIDRIDLGDAVKWKIAFLYSDFNIINIFKFDALKICAEYLGYEGADKSYSALNRFIISQKGNKDYFEFSNELWKEFETPSEVISISTTEIQTDFIELNQIFFGPPGTGKTYNTINEAIKIVDPEFYKVNHNDREALKQRFKLLLLNNDNENVGQIGFTTFHQSMSYEDFIEGIKPVNPEPNDTFLKYKIQDGIFKRICRIANDSLNAVDVNPDTLLSLSSEDFDKAHFYKMSLGNSQSDLDNEIYDYCIENNCISLGWGDGYDYTGKDEISIKEFGNTNGIERFSITAINQFKVLLKVGDYVIISNGNYYVRAIGKVVGEYEFKAVSPFANNPNYNQFRNVEWIFKDKSIPVTEIYNKNLSQQTIYQLIKSEVKQEFFVKDKKIDLVKLPKNPKNYVLIIDEINRGNVSSIFGELITLIEKDKRAGTNEELSVILPYSKKEFKVPHNVYIIGTMNTADRSIEALDTALRRRFSFKEMPPKPNLIATEGKLYDKNGKLGSIDLVAILTVINNRIEKLIDKDHKIGHSFFLGIKNEQDLKNAFKDKVIPLLEEYFYGDFGKISLVLGNSFISKSANNDVSFARVNDYDSSISADLLERSVYEITHSDNWDFEAIYQ